MLPEGLATGVAVPAGQRSHEDCPSYAEKVPALQAAQLACPSSDCDLPATHAVQLPCFTAVVMDPGAQLEHTVALK